MILLYLLIHLSEIVAINKFNYQFIIQNAYKHTTAYFLSDNTKILLWGGNKTQITVLNAFDFTQASNGLLFAALPLQLDRYFDNYNTIFYSFNANQVRKFQLVQFGSTDVISYKFQDNVTKIIKIGVSYDNQYYTFITEEANKLYFGNTNIQTKIQQVIPYQSKLITFKWQPHSTNIAISSTNKFQLYDFDKKLSVQYKLSQVNITSIQFSQKGDIIYFIQENNNNFVSYWKVGDNTSIINKFTAFNTTGFIKLYRQGNFLAATDLNSVHIWNIVDQKYYQQYYSNIKSNPLSSQGSSLLTYDVMSNNFKIFKICPQHQVFDNQINNCVSCDSSCLTCFQTTKKCYKCANKYYNQNYICKNCIVNCNICKDGINCQNCTIGFYYIQNKCQSCSASLVGCQICSNSSKCQKCLNQGWILNNNSQCMCDNRYVQVQSKCVRCPQHCFTCKSATECITCDISQHRILNITDNKCLCDVKYFQFQNICQQCISGCLQCLNNKSCITCDTQHNWFIQNFTCFCQQNYLKIADQCKSCAKLIDNCIACDKDKQDKLICTKCQNDYNIVDGRCNMPEQSSYTTIIIVIIVGFVVVGGGIGGYILFKMKKKKNHDMSESMPILHSDAIKAQINDKS